MFLRKRLFSVLMVVVMAMGAVAPFTQTHAQSTTPVIISVGVPSFSSDAITQKMIDDFEAAHPDINLQIVPETNAIPSAAQSGLSTHLDDVQKYASSADVLYIDSNSISAEAVRAGYYLDLAPLVSDDKTLNTDDFFPNIWSAFQWDKGVWGLPVSADVTVLTYKPSAFDAAGIAYPSDTWTMDDISKAAEKLAVKDPSGAVTTVGLAANPTSLALLFRDLLGEGMFDTSVVPNQPKLDKGNAAAMLDTWHQLEKDGVVSETGGFGQNPNIPMGIGSAFGVLFSKITTDNNEQSVGVLLPGGKAGLTTQGFAVSAGTQNPDKAYQVAKFLTTRAEVANLLSASPARKSLLGSTTAGGGFALKVPPEVQKIIDAGVANGIPLSELRYSDYISLALIDMKTNNTDAKTALQNAETTAIKNANDATAKKATLKFSITEPVPVLTTLANGKQILNFGVQSFVSPLPDKDKWDAIIKDFVANDPQIGQINLNELRDATSATDGKNDCFYLPSNNVPNAKLDKLLNIDPFLAADTSFDKSDVVGNTMAQLTRDNKIWALPVIISPSVLKYDPTRFDKAGVKAPANGWTITDFTDSLKALKQDPSDPPAFAPSNTGGTYLFELIAAYGGLPLDYRTTPVTINYTDPTNEAAIKQVLDIAKAGYFKYTGLGSLRFDFGNNGNPSTIVNSTLNGFNFRFGAAGRNTTDPLAGYQSVTYPKGTTYNAVAYDVGTTYIVSTAKNPEGCYRFMSTIAKHPELFNGMPARNSLISDPTISATNGPDLTALYTEIAKTLKDPNTIAVPTIFSGGSNPTTFIYQYWLFGAFDDYVLKDGNLESDLKDAQDKSISMQTCTQSLPALDPSSVDSRKQYIKSFGQCATKIDPKLGVIFSLIGG